MKWFSVDESLPEDGRNVLCYRGVMVTGWYLSESCPYEKKRKGWHCDWSGELRKEFKSWPVTHWMYLPDRPGYVRIHEGKTNE